MTWGWSWTSRTAWPCSTWGRRSPTARRTRCARTRASSRPTSARPGPRATEGADMADIASTLPRLMERNARELADRPALREKDRGIWQTYSWREYHDQVRDLALGLTALGFARGDALSVIGDNRPRLYWAQMAAMSLGGRSVPVYQDAIAKELAFVLHHAEVTVVVAEDQEQVDKILALKDQLPKLRLMVYDDPRGMVHYKADWVRSFAEVQALGRERAAREPAAFAAEVERGRPEDVALICYTSGTTGSPKGAMLTHDNVIAIARSFVSVEKIVASDDYLAYLPMAWVGDALYSMVLSLVVGFCMNCPESPETVQRDLRELGPTAHLGKHADRGTGTRRRRHPAQAPGLRLLPPGRGGGGDPPRRRQVAADRAPAQVGARRVLRVPAGARSARPPPRPVVPHRWRAARAGHVPLLPGLRGEPQADLWLHRDHRAGLAAAGWGGRSQHRGPALPGDRRPHRRPGGGARQEPGDLQGVLQGGGGHPRGPGRGGLVSHRRRRLHRPPRAPRHHRPRQRRGRHAGRHPLRPSVHREQAQVQPVHPRGGVLRQRAALRGGHDRHRHEHGGELGGAAGAPLHELHGSRPEGGGPAPPRGGDRQGQRDAAGVHPHPPPAPPHQGPRGRRRRDDPDPEGPPAVRGREVCAGGRGLLRRRRRGGAVDGHHLRGWPAGRRPLARPHRGRGERPRPCLTRSASSSCSCPTA